LKENNIYSYKKSFSLTNLIYDIIINRTYVSIQNEVIDMVDMVDRGIKKWQPFIMPENKSMYNQVFKDDLKLKKPILDEDQLHSINDILVQSVMEETEIKLTLWFDGFIEDIKPVIVKKIDPYQRKIVVQYKNGQQSFWFEPIINAQTL
jgi:hypothetical protein